MSALPGGGGQARGADVTGTDGASLSLLPQPQPDWPAAFASASRTQQASLEAGAGPPQQAEASTGAGDSAMVMMSIAAGVEPQQALTGSAAGSAVDPVAGPLQTPVSGSVNSTRDAA
jgi:hypothetical protein